MYLLKQEVLSLSVQREIHRILVDTGYTEADYEKDMENAKELEQTSYPVFNMALYVTLDGERVDVPGAHGRNPGIQRRHPAESDGAQDFRLAGDGGRPAVSSCRTAPDL